MVREKEVYTGERYQTMAWDEERSTPVRNTEPLKVDYSAVGGRIRRLRKGRNLSQKELCEELNITQGHLSKVENRGAVISDALIELIAEKFGVSSSFIKYGKEGRDSFAETVEARPGKTVPTSTAPAASLSINKLRDLVLKGQEAAEILAACDAEYSFIVNEIHDVDSILQRDNILYPATAYVFKLDLEVTDGGYIWKGQETSHCEIPRDYIFKSDDGREYGNERLKYSKGRKIKDPIGAAKYMQENGLESIMPEELPEEFLEPEENDDVIASYLPFSELGNNEIKKLIADVEGKRSRKKEFQNTIAREPYYFEMSTPMSADEDLEGSYRDAKAMAMYKAAKQPEGPDDPAIVGVVKRKEDCSIDWKGEFERFISLIHTSVAGKSMTSSDIYGGQYFSTQQYYEGREYGLNNYGAVRVQRYSSTYGSDTYAFKIDDKLLSPEQFAHMLTAYEGWKIEFKITAE